LSIWLLLEGQQAAAGLVVIQTLAVAAQAVCFKVLLVLLLVLPTL
jgi:hypothetical protein